MNKIENLKAKVKERISIPDWEVSQCFFLGMTGSSSPEMVMCNKKSDSYKAIVRSTLVPEEKRLRKLEWNKQAMSEADSLEKTLSPIFKLSRDGSTIYVKSAR